MDSGEKVGAEVQRDGMEGPRARTIRTVRPYLVTLAGGKIILARCAFDMADLKDRLGIAAFTEARAMQIDAAGDLHPHHGSGECAAMIALVSSVAAKAMIELWNAAHEAGAAIIDL